MNAEISYDLVMDDHMSFVEGTYRLAGGEWQVFVFARKDVVEPRIELSQWDSGITGLFVSIPRVLRLNRAIVEKLLSAALGVTDWTIVRGPDSMQLR